MLPLLRPPGPRTNGLRDPKHRVTRGGHFLHCFNALVATRVGGQLFASSNNAATRDQVFSLCNNARYFNHILFLQYLCDGQNNHRLGRPSKKMVEHPFLEHLNARSGGSDRSQTRWSKIERLRFSVLPKKQCLDDDCTVLYSQALVSEPFQEKKF